MKVRGKEIFLNEWLVQQEGIIGFFLRDMDLERLDALSSMRGRKRTDYYPLKCTVGGKDAG